jgi:hypothetical protein
VRLNKFRSITKGVIITDLKTAIKEYNPYNRQEEKDKQILIDCINRFDDIRSKKNQIIYIISSGFVAPPGFYKVKVDT